MSNHCYAPQGTVLLGPIVLPTTWTDPQTGNYYSNLPALSAAELLAVGWYPYVENDPGAPGLYYLKQYGPFVVNPTNVTRDVTYVQQDIEEVRAIKNGELESEANRYTQSTFGDYINEQALNNKINEYIRNDAKWYDDKQAELVRLTDWNAVANFDTSKPAVLALPNSFVAQSYVDQGVRLTAENNAAESAGLAKPYDQAIINTFVSANQTAANDSSNNTSPTMPGYQIRQPIANVSEQFNRIVIFRFDVDDPNPALRRNYGMRMRNRQDNRNLYVFSYTNSTYLTWRLFELQPDGVTWALEGTPAEQQYTDTDMNFIFSYGTNPAVEADYFTDQVPFPAGVEQQSVLVAWDPV